jgi:hypothetical protein
MDIKHTPVFDTKQAEEKYSESDGVPINYVCTTELEGAQNIPVDIFYRATPHPEFGNHYFGLLKSPRSGKSMIIGADSVEKENFALVETTEGLMYSRYRHDCRMAIGANGKNVMIDGGRAYVRAMGPTRSFVVVDGKMTEAVKEEV